MSKQVKATKVKTKVPARSPVAIDHGNRFWLAGLGAFALAQKQGSTAFDTLVSEGKRMQVRGAKVVRTLEGEMRVVVSARLAPFQRRFDDLRSKATARFERGVGRALSYAGVPSKADVDVLIKRIDTLSRQLRTTR